MRGIDSGTQDTVALGFQSALEHLTLSRYRSAGAFRGCAELFGIEPEDPARRTVELDHVPHAVPGERRVAELLGTGGALQGLSRPLHLLVGTRGACGLLPSRTAHLWSTPVPRGSFAQVAPGVLAPSPELCFIQAARTLTRVELVRLACELCGYYALAPHPGEEFAACPPATSVAYLQSFAQAARAVGMRGATDALWALNYALDGSASPMETVCIMLLCLPYRLGGYGLPLPVLNQALSLPVNRKQLTARDNHRCDLYWPAFGVVLEYEGKKGHTAIASVDRDSRRDNALAGNRALVIKVTQQQLYDVDAFDLVARQLMGIMHRRLRTNACDYDWNDRRGDLRMQLLPGNNNPRCNERVGRGNS